MCTGWRQHRVEARKIFFFEKKRQKTFAPWLRRLGPHYDPHMHMMAGSGFQQ
jgi:hypothetical protein